MRILAGVAMGIVAGGLFMLVEHLTWGIHPIDFWGIARAIGTIGVVVGFVVGLVWEFIAMLNRQPAVNPSTPTSDAATESE